MTSAKLETYLFYLLGGFLWLFVWFLNYIVQVCMFSWELLILDSGPADIKGVAKCVKRCNVKASGRLVYKPLQKDGRFTWSQACIRPSGYLGLAS